MKQVTCLLPFQSSAFYRAPTIAQSAVGLKLEVKGIGILLGSSECGSSDWWLFVRTLLSDHVGVLPLWAIYAVGASEFYPDVLDPIRSQISIQDL